MELFSGINESAEKQHCLSFNSGIDANLCSPIGALISNSKTAWDKEFTLYDSSSNIETLNKNYFYNMEFGVTYPHDANTRDIAYWRGQQSIISEWMRRWYVDEFYIRGMRGLPIMPEQLLRNTRDSLYEIYNNVLEHSESQYGLFTCGQYFPAKERLKFTITDLGIGFQECVNKNLKLEVDMSSEQAIIWATDGNTVKEGAGGLGLKHIITFLKSNKGDLHIVSYDTYAIVISGKLTCRKLPKRFPGTSITVEIRTDDNNEDNYGIDPKQKINF